MIFDDFSITKRLRKYFNNRYFYFLSSRGCYLFANILPIRFKYILRIVLTRKDITKIANDEKKP